MEINKQLFEDVLSGKLKGTFIRKDGIKLDSSLLVCGGYIDDRLYIIGTDVCYIYYSNGVVRTSPHNPNLNIIDFIAETNMKENELTIEIPEGKTVDWDESKKENKIVLKDKPLTYEEVCEKLFEKGHFMIVDWGGIRFNGTKTGINCSNNAATEHQLECILAKNKLAIVAKYLNDGWKPCRNFTGNFVAWVLYLTPGKDYIGCGTICNCRENSNVLFKSEELAQQAIEILGEEIVKLALEPLGI